MTASAALPPASSSSTTLTTHTAANNDTAASPPTSPPAGLKICCACPDTRKPRDTCVVEQGPENCTEFIEQHKQCLRALGFKV